MNYRKRLNFMFIKMREPIFGFAIASIVIATLLLYKLDTLVPGLSASELMTKIKSSSLSNIFANPVNLPYKLFQWIIQYFGKYNPMTTRLVSVLFASLAIMLVFYVLNKWYTLRIAVLGTIMFATSAWFLHIARLATPSTLYLSIIGLIAYGTWIKYTNRHEIALITGLSFAMYLTYIPGMIWFLALGLVWQRRTVAQLIKNANNITMIASFITVILLLPLGWGIYQNPVVAKELLGLPANMPTLSQAMNNILAIPRNLFWSGPVSPEYWLDTIPLLNVFMMAMLFMGSYAFFVRSRLDRSKMILGSLILTTALVSLNGSSFMFLFLPLIFLIISGGVALMLQRWFKVFPRNPLARNIGVGLIIATVLLSSSYELKHYFVAWPNSPITKITFNKQL